MGRYNKCPGSRAPSALQRGVSAVSGHVTAAALLSSSDGTLSCWKLNCQENLNRYYLISTENLEHFHISVLKNSKFWSWYKLKMFKISKRPFVSSTVQSEAPTCPKCISKRRVWRCNVKCVCMYSIKNINIGSRAGHSVGILIKLFYRVFFSQEQEVNLI